MAYSKRNFLTKIIDIQQTTLENQSKGASQKWIYENLIYPNYFISKRTYCNYLGINAKKQVTELDRAEVETKSNQQRKPETLKR